MESNYTTIPKVLSPREKLEYDQEIPKIIWQTMKSNQVPAFMKDYADTWIENNPEYEYRFFDDDDMIDFISSDFPAYLEAFKKIKYGASKADLWRYLIMYKYGGVYVDLDCRCINPLRQWIEPGAKYVTQLGINKDFCQWLIISIPQNPIFLRAAQKALHNVEHNSCQAEYHGFEVNDGHLAIRVNEPLNKVNDKVFGLAGTPVLQEAAETCFREGLLTDLLSSIQIVCVSGAKSCQMKGNVAHDSAHPDYRKALRMLKTPHYDRFISRTFRRFYALLDRK
jgi:hypothetical protein